MKETHIPNDIAVLMATAMAVGASSSKAVQTTRTIFSPDGKVNVTRTEISFTFHHPCDHSPYRPPVGSTLEESMLALLRGEWPFPYSPDPSPPPTSANSRTNSRANSPANSRANSRASSPPRYQLDFEPGNFDFDKLSLPNTRCDRRARKRAIPPPERWYTVTRGLCVGVVLGAFRARTLTRGVDRAVVVHYASQELAEAAFDLALRAGSVEVL
ncbi:hypothetical protein FIBSPDRAFT_887754 [Athelia psychrophila]|uniref:Uncharacterized protein n=1 Tax=Athelia psychrophila TaxID=1759441 RepID=A0A166P717_9AGAM|nr:hypothetical protein FIBSPDRAFT_887754 [Fibularhizoctonia sp. CBS 109695]